MVQEPAGASGSGAAAGASPSGSEPSSSGGAAGFFTDVGGGAAAGGEADVGQVGGRQTGLAATGDGLNGGQGLCAHPPRAAHRSHKTLDATPSVEV